MKIIYQVRKFTYQILLLFGIVLSVISCTSPKQTNLLQSNTKPYYSVKPFEEYRLKANDEIYCNIITKNMEFMEEYANAFSQIISSDGANSQTFYKIYDNGNISIPFFGDIHVAGETIAEAEQTIQRKMRNYFPDVQVRVALRNNLFYVVSSQKNGVYGVFKENMTIYQALALSGNINEDIDLSKIKIVRLNDDGETSVIKTFNLRTESIIESEFYYIKPNDVIYYTTSQSSFFRVKSFTSLFTTIITPITFFISMLAIDFK